MAHLWIVNLVAMFGCWFMAGYILYDGYKSNMMGLAAPFAFFAFAVSLINIPFILFTF